MMCVLVHLVSVDNTSAHAECRQCDDEKAPRSYTCDCAQTNSYIGLRVLPVQGIQKKSCQFSCWNIGSWRASFLRWWTRCGTWWIFDPRLGTCTSSS